MDAKIGRRKNNRWRGTEEESVSNDESFIFVPKAGKFGWPACVCMESVALGIMAKSQPQTVLSRRGSAMH